MRIDTIYQIFAAIIFVQNLYGQNVSPAEERVEETVGVRASPTPSTARSAARRWPPTRGRAAGMDSAEDVNTWMA